MMIFCANKVNDSGALWFTGVPSSNMSKRFWEFDMQQDSEVYIDTDCAAAFLAHISQHATIGDAIASFYTVLQPGSFICEGCGNDAFANGGNRGECKGCHAVSYCSKECRDSDWKQGHNIECAAIQNKDSWAKYQGELLKEPVPGSLTWRHFTRFAALDEAMQELEAAEIQSDIEHIGRRGGGGRGGGGRGGGFFRGGGRWGAPGRGWRGWRGWGGRPWFRPSFRLYRGWWPYGLAGYYASGIWYPWWYNIPPNYYAQGLAYPGYGVPPAPPGSWGYLTPPAGYGVGGVSVGPGGVSVAPPTMVLSSDIDAFLRAWTDGGVEVHDTNIDASVLIDEEAIGDHIDSAADVDRAEEQALQELADDIGDHLALGGADMDDVFDDRMGLLGLTFLIGHPLMSLEDADVDKLAVAYDAEHVGAETEFDHIEATARKSKRGANLITRSRDRFRKSRNSKLFEKVMEQHGKNLVKRMQSQGRGAESDKKSELSAWTKHLKQPGHAVMAVIHEALEESGASFRSDDIKLVFQHVFEVTHYDFETRVMRAQQPKMGASAAGTLWARFWTFYSVPDHVIVGMESKISAYKSGRSGTPTIGASVPGTTHTRDIMIQLEEDVYSHHIESLRDTLQFHLRKVEECAAKMKPEMFPEGSGPKVRRRRGDASTLPISAPISRPLPESCISELMDTSRAVGRAVDTVMSKTDLIRGMFAPFSDALVDHSNDMIEAAYRFSGITGDVAEFAQVGQNIDASAPGEGGGFFEQFTRLEQAAYTRKACREDLGEASDKLALAFIASSSVLTFDPTNSIFFKQQLANLQDGLRDHLDLMRDLGTSMTVGLSHLILDNLCAELRSNAADIGTYMDRIACGTCGGGGGGHGDDKDDKDQDVNSEFIFSSDDFDLSGLQINTQLIGKNWIHGAIKHPGAFRNAAAHADHGRFKGHTAAFARHVMANQDHKHGGSTIRHRAQLALTLAKLRKRK
jgi:hypothetical protein